VLAGPGSGGLATLFPRDAQAPVAQLDRAAFPTGIDGALTRFLREGYLKGLERINIARAELGCQNCHLFHFTFFLDGSAILMHVTLIPNKDGLPSLSSVSSGTEVAWIASEMVLWNAKSLTINEVDATDATIRRLALSHYAQGLSLPSSI
jgi:hypothetical protein